MVQDRERAGRWIAGPPTSTGCVGSVQLIPTSRRHRQDEDHPQIPENDKGESHQRQILFPWEKDLLLPREPHTVSQGSLTPVFQYASLGRPHHGWQLSYSPQGTWNKIRDHSRNNSWLVWYGTTSAPNIHSLVRWYRLLLLPGTYGQTLWRWHFTFFFYFYKNIKKKFGQKNTSIQSKPRLKTL